MNVQRFFTTQSGAAVLAAVFYVAGKSLLQQFGFDFAPVDSVPDAAGFGNAGLALIFAIGHCDGLDGPVVTLARKALENGNVSLVLPWVQAGDENQVKAAFDEAMSVRRLGPAAKQFADMYFFETLVRIHRAGEGAPYTGLQPAGRDLGPAIPAADRALADGSVETVVRLVTDAVARGIRERFNAARSRQDFDRNNVRAGREYVEAYVPYIHYVERLFDDATAHAHGHQHEATESAAHVH